jgi:HSP20 family protein
MVPFARRIPDLPFIRLPEMWADWTDEDMLKVEEYRDGDAVVIRADLPGIDPDKDVNIDILDGALRVSAERRKEEKIEEKDYVRTELRYGSFSRTVPLPAGASEQDVAATYKDGVLEIRVPFAAAQAPEAKKIPITRS